ncbi:MAG: hypothetical protein M1376_01400 [Planctomycetes bacterium]|nr:hypothetical protein [Planctomycetota bacterium]
MEYENNLNWSFENQIEAFRDSWPDAYAFLQTLSDNRRGFWLSTVLNAHSYYKDAFIAHVTLRKNEMELSPRPNGPISQQTQNESDILFCKIDSLILRHGGLAKGWGDYPFDGGVYVLSRPAPGAFFDDLIKTIEEGYRGLSEKRGRVVTCPTDGGRGNR